MSLRRFARENVSKPIDKREYRCGRTGLLGFFVDQAMGRTGGRANPALLKTIVEEQLRT